MEINKITFQKKVNTENFNLKIIQPYQMQPTKLNKIKI